MVNKHGGGTKMIKGLNLPEKILGTDSRLIVLWLEPIILGMVIFFSTVLIIVPKIGEIPQRIAQIKSIKTKTAGVNQKNIYLKAMSQEEIKDNALKLSMGLLPEKSSYLLVGVIRNLAADVNYAVDDFSLSMVSNKNTTAKKNGINFEKLPVAITLIGPSENYINLIKAIERSLPVISIDNIDMRNSSDGGVAVVKLNVTAYYLPEIGKVNFENLSLSDLTPNEEELKLLSKISEYKTMTVEATGGDNTNFTKYERQDPFFTP